MPVRTATTSAIACSSTTMPPARGSGPTRSVGLLDRGQLALEAVDALLDLTGVLVGLGVDGRLLLGTQVLDLGAQPVGGGADVIQPQPRPGLIDQVDRLVGQTVFADVAVRQTRRCLQRLVADLHAVMLLVLRAQAVQDLDGVLDRGLLDHHGREAPGKRGIVLDPAVLGQRRGTDHPQLTASQHRLEHACGVHRALGATGAQDGVQLVDEQDDLCPRRRRPPASAAFSRCSKAPRNWVPATMPARSSAMTRTPRSGSGTSFSAIRRARPSAIAVLPTPASPISAALFLRRRVSVSTTCSISLVRPMTGSTRPARASAVRSVPNSSRVCVAERCRVCAPWRAPEIGHPGRRPDRPPAHRTAAPRPPHEHTARTATRPAVRPPRRTSPGQRPVAHHTCHRAGRPGGSFSQKPRNSPIRFQI